MTLFEDTRPARLDGGDAPDAWADFRLDDGREIAGLLRQLRDGSVPMIVSAPGGASLSTTVWDIDAERGNLNFSAEPTHPQLERLLAADEAVAVGYLENVKLQFDLHDLLLVRAQRSCALQARLPRTVYRFQRRGTYRVRPLARHAPNARLRHPAIPDMMLELRVIDVSGGGCALFLPDDVPPLEPGVQVQGVLIELDADTRFAAALMIQNVGTLQAGDHGLRVGCEWHRLEPTASRVLQRYIDQTQKRRRLLSLE